MFMLCSVMPRFLPSLSMLILAGVDAPDKNCPAGWTQARRRVVELLGPTTRLSAIQWGKYAGRLTTRDGRDLSAELLAEGMALPYTGRGRRPRHC